MDAFYGEIRIFGFSFPPQNWAQCNGQTTPIQQNPVLYSVIGIQFGGDGKTTYKLPNLQGSAVCQAGQGPGLTPRLFGKTTGATTVTLTQSQMPVHQHAFNALMPGPTAMTDAPTATSRLGRTLNQLDFTNTDTFDTTLAPQMVGAFNGANGSHENRQPFLAMNFCICMYGDYPVKAE